MTVKRLLIRGNVEIIRGSRMRSVVALAHRSGVDSLLDVGANEGQFARLARSAGFNGAIHSYEPMRREFEIARAHAAKDPRWWVEHTALGAEAGRSTIHVSTNSYSSSLLAVGERHLSAAPASTTQRTEAVEVRTLDAEMGRLNLDPRRILLKIDTQGYERQVLAGGATVLPQVPILQLELSLVDLYEGGPVFDEFYPWLREHGWRLWSLEPGFTARDGEMLQCDGVFVRTRT